ncbi:tyrosine-protein phosphatase [Paenibacillus koleovorans]|uniref:tyrosine-protein phosphatase n=1 Tax=Paenibacillus koleovorans TaxID=121608 RepID=UPI000FDB3D4F|nr:CpsB/CapC family capsule biosynthesis tyrosine phosphatase [Paenibacillus koleovorans]
MIDIHTHILPGMDDGATDIDESLRIARAAVDEGIHTVIATPHHANGKYMNPADKIRSSVDRLNEELVRAQIPLQVLTGQEIRLTRQLLEDWDQGQLLSLSNSKYLLIELPSGHVPEYTEDYLFELMLSGVQPIIAHPERNAELASDPDLLHSLVSKGVLAQLTSHSLNGLFGPKIQQLSIQLCKRNLVQFLSSDVHHLETRGIELSKAYRIVEQHVGQERVLYYKENSTKVLASESIDLLEPQKEAKKWFLSGFFTKFR